MFYFVIYVLLGCLVAYYIYRDGEFRPIDTTAYMIASIFVWPFVIPVWLVLRPSSQLKDLTYEKSHAHYKHWAKTHKGRDLGDLSYLEKNKNGENGNKDAVYADDFSGQTSEDSPYVIGGGKGSSEFLRGFNADDYYWDDNSDDLKVYEIGSSSNPRKVYNPFEGKSKKKKETPTVPETNGHKQGGTRSGKSSVPSIDDILDNTISSQSQKKKAEKAITGKPFVDHNVRKLIDDGRLRDAYRVSRRMLKVAHELGEEDRAKAYQRYLNEIENRIKAKQKDELQQ